MKDKSFKLAYNGFAPLNLSDDWAVSSPTGEGMDSLLLDEAFRLVYTDYRFTMARSLLVIRNGKLVAEAYPHEAADADRIANIQSMTKSFTSILTGIALSQNVLDSLDQTLSGI
jgi:CubicO group peptidase (beta-lactamase class C family)